MKLRISHRVMIISFFLLLLAGCREEEIVFSYSNSIVVVLMFTDKAYNRSILEGDYPIETFRSCALQPSGLRLQRIIRRPVRSSTLCG
jgi:hypothetical protein